MYGCETWTILKQPQKKLYAKEMWFQGRMLRIYWAAKKLNETVLREAITTRSLVIKNVKVRQLFMAIMEKIEQLVTTGIFEGKRRRGKQQENILAALTKWLNIGRVTDALRATMDRDGWKVMVAYAQEHGT